LSPGRRRPADRLHGPRHPLQRRPALAVDNSTSCYGRRRPPSPRLERRLTTTAVTNPSQRQPRRC
jgi:hypothetical protein